MRSLHFNVFLKSIIINFVCLFGIIPLNAFSFSLPPPPIVDITVDASSPAIKQINQGLNDFSYFPGSNDDVILDVVKEKGPGFASLIKLDVPVSQYDCSTNLLREGYLEALNQQIDSIQALGGEPLLVFHGTPECIARPPSFILELIFGEVPTQRPPQSAELYGTVVESILRMLTIDRINDGKKPISYLYSWVEPDFFIWYKGFWPEFIDNIFIPLGLAVQKIEAETGLDLQLYTAATSSMLSSFFLGPGNINYGYIEDMVSVADEYQFDLEGIAWNYYACYPFIGTGKSEFIFGEPIDTLVNFFLKRINPVASAKLYHNQVKTLKERYPDKTLVLTEWSIIVGGEDERTHNHEGASLVASGMSAMQDAGLDFANLFSLHFDDDFSNRLHGLLKADGTGDQRWHALDLWAQLGKDQLSINEGVNDPIHDVWSTVTRHDNGDISVLIANHRGVPRYEKQYLNIRLNNFTYAASTVSSQWIEPGLSAYGGPVTKELGVDNYDGGTSVNVSMKNQSVVFIHFKKQSP